MGDALDEQLFGGLSISSLDSGGEGEDVVEDEELSTHTNELYQRLQDLEEMTGSFLHGRPLLLSSTYASYADLEPGQSQEFKLVLPTFDVSEVLTISVACVSATSAPQSGNANDENAQNSPGGCHELADDESKPVSCPSPVALSLYQLRRTDDHNRTLSPMKNDYIYEIRPQSVETQQQGAASGVTGQTGILDLTLTAADGISAGTYFLRLTSLGNGNGHQQPAAGEHFPESVVSQQVRLAYNVHRSIRAADVKPGERLRGVVNQGQMTFFRYTHDASKHNKLITIRVTPLPAAGSYALSDSAGVFNVPNSCDPDLYVSNTHGGLVGVTRATAQWSSESAGCDRIDIHPSDPHRSRGSVFIIGVLGHREVNSFELSVLLSDPPVLRPFAPGSEVTVSLETGQAEYYAMPMPPPGRRVVLSVVPCSFSSSSSSSSSS